MIYRSIAALSITLLLATQATAGYVDLVANDPGLVSYWRFEGEITSGGTLVDENGNTNPGTYESGISAEPNGVVGQAGFFDGDDGSVVTIANEQNFNFTESMTIEAWIRTDEFTRGWQSVIGKGDDQWRLHRGCTDGCAELKFGTEDGSSPADTPDTFVDVDDNMWHHIVAVFDGTDELGEGPEKTFYIDRELITSQPIVGLLRTEDSPTPPDPPNLPVMIGGNSEYPDEGYRAWSGYIDEVAIYSRALSEAEVIEHFNADKSSGLVGDFDKSGILDAPDIDDLTARSASQLNPVAYDLNGDSSVNQEDVKVWVKDLFNSWIGDANLDHEFNSGDLVVVLSSGTYEADVDAVWSTGDFNGDGRTNSSDLVAALSDGGYELGPRAAVSAVPEPSSFVLLTLGTALLARSRTQRTAETARNRTVGWRLGTRGSKKRKGTHRLPLPSSGGATRVAEVGTHCSALGVRAPLYNELTINPKPMVASTTAQGHCVDARPSPMPATKKTTPKAIPITDLEIVPALRTSSFSRRISSFGDTGNRSGFTGGVLESIVRLIMIIAFLLGPLLARGDGYSGRLARAASRLAHSTQGLTR